MKVLVVKFFIVLAVALTAGIALYFLSTKPSLGIFILSIEIILVQSIYQFGNDCVEKSIEKEHTNKLDNINEAFLTVNENYIKVQTKLDILEKEKKCLKKNVK